MNQVKYYCPKCKTLLVLASYMDYPIYFCKNCTREVKVVDGRMIEL